MRRSLVFDDLIRLTTQIVAGYVGRNAIAVADLPELIRGTYQALSSAAAPLASQPAAPMVPAVPVRKSVQPGHVVCLECGKKLKMLKRHLRTDHGLTADEYRAKWGLAEDYPVVAPEYAKQRSTLALKLGLGRPKLHVVG